MIVVGRYRKKPIVVEAEQFFPDKKPWPRGVVANVGESYYWVTTIHRQKTKVAPGDWIVLEGEGDLAYPCKPDIFEVTYEEADPAPKPNRFSDGVPAVAEDHFDVING